MKKKNYPRMDMLPDLWSVYEQKQSEFDTGAETSELRRLFEALPETQALHYIAGLRSATAQKDPADFIKHCGGLAFEISRLMIVTMQGLEEVSDAPHKIPNDRRETFATFSTPEEISRDVVIKLENDVSVSRDGKPVIYDTKFYPARLYGVGTQNLNQLLKYEAAVEKGIVAACVIEIQGRVDAGFLRWAYGSALNDDSPIPHVQIIYSLPLPSGAEYRFDLKACKDPAQSFRYKNDERHYTPEDRAVVAGILRARRNPNKSTLIDIISGTHIHGPSKELAPYLDDEDVYGPTKIESLELFREYQSKRLEGIWEKAREAQQPLYNNDNKDCATSQIFADHEQARRLIHQRVEAFQQGLRENPQLAKIKSSYVLGDPRSPDYQEKVERSVDFIFRNMMSVREVELARQNSPVFLEQVKQYKHNGWVCQGDGLALDIDHIMLDAIMEANKRPGQKGRSYTNPEQRFLTMADMLAEMTPDRDELELAHIIADPLATGPKEIEKKGITRKYIQEREIQILQINIERAQKFLPYLVDQQMELGALPVHEQVAVTAMRKQCNGKIESRARYHDTPIAKQREDIASRRENMEALGKELGATYKNKRAMQPAEFSAKIETLQTSRLESEQHYQKALSKLSKTYAEVYGQSWQKIAVRGRVEELNIVKYIYVTLPDGTMRFAHEKMADGSSGRAAHSELAGGKNTYGAGEIVWDKATGSWVLTEINNGSGHYRPPVATLPFVAKMFKKGLAQHLVQKLEPEADAKAIVESMTNKVRLSDALLRGVKVSGLSDVSLDSPISLDSGPTRGVAGRCTYTTAVCGRR